MATGAIDELLNWAIYKLKDKSENILITIMFVLMVYLGGFGGTDALIAVVPIGVIFTKKLKLDPICAIGVSSYATLLGFGTGPTKQFITQLMMGVPVYGAFFTMFISMNFFMLLGLFLLLRYVKKIRKDPTKSLMWSEGWNPANMKVTAEEEAKLSQGTKLSGRTIAILVLFLGQYGILVAYPLLGGDGNYLQHLMTALALFVAIVCGFIGGFSFDKVGDEFVKGLQGLVFVGFVIGDPHHGLCDDKTAYGLKPCGVQHRNDRDHFRGQPADPLRYLQGRDPGTDLKTHRGDLKHGFKRCGAGVPVRRRIHQHGFPVPGLDRWILRDGGRAVPEVV